MKKIIIILFFTFPHILFSQTEKEKYKHIISFVQDSITNDSDSNDYFLSKDIQRKTEIFDFLGISTNCEIQHQLLLEILINGEQSKITESEMTILIPYNLRNESKKYKIELSTIISYRKIWATVVTLKDVQINDNEWTKYSLLFVDNKLIGQMIGEWHADP